MKASNFGSALLATAAALTTITCLTGFAAVAAQANATHVQPAPEGAPMPNRVSSRAPPLTAAKTALVEFSTAPFPYNGLVPETRRPFLNVTDGRRRGHRTGGGTVYWQDATYSDRRALLYLPRGFDARRPALLVVFLHGNGATLERDVRDRQQVPAQLAASGINAALVAPQLAVDAHDSSAGRFWEAGTFRKFLNEAAGHLAGLHGDRRTNITFETAPVVIIAYSGGFVPAAWALRVGGATRRVKGVVLLDALYGEFDKYADWIETQKSGFFVSAFTKSTGLGNTQLQQVLTQRHLPFDTQMQFSLNNGSVTFLASDEQVTHQDFVTEAWSPNPIQDVLGRIQGYARKPQ